MVWVIRESPNDRSTRTAPTSGPCSTTVTASRVGQVGVPPPVVPVDVPGVPVVRQVGVQLQQVAACARRQHLAAGGQVAHGGEQPVGVELDPDQAVVERTVVAATRTGCRRCGSLAAMPRATAGARAGTTTVPVRRVPSPTSSDLGPRPGGLALSTHGRSPSPSSARAAAATIVLQLGRDLGVGRPRPRGAPRRSSCPAGCRGTGAAARSSRAGPARRTGSRARSAPPRVAAHSSASRSRCSLRRLPALVRAWLVYVARCSSRYSSPDQTGASGTPPAPRRRTRPGCSIDDPRRALQVAQPPGLLQHLPGRAAAAVAVAERQQRPGAAALVGVVAHGVRQLRALEACRCRCRPAGSG